MAVMGAAVPSHSAVLLWALPFLPRLAALVLFCHLKRAVLGLVGEILAVDISTFPSTPQVPAINHLPSGLGCAGEGDPNAWSLLAAAKDSQVTGYSQCLLPLLHDPPPVAVWAEVQVPLQTWSYLPDELETTVNLHTCILQSLAWTLKEEPKAGLLLPAQLLTVTHPWQLLVSAECYYNT